MSVLKQTMEARLKAQTELRSLYDSALDEKGEVRSLTAEETQVEERLGAQISDLQKRELNLVSLDADEKRSADAAAASRASGIEAPAVKPDVHAELRSLAKGEVRSVDIGYEARDLSSVTATDGAELVPTTMFSEIHALVQAQSPILNVARIIRTAGGEKLTLPRVTSNSVAALVAQGAAVGESDPQYATVELDAYKYGFLVDVSPELENDAAFSIEGHLTEMGAAAIARGTNAAFMIGDGSSKPQGVITGATVGKTTAAVAAVTVDELIDLQHSIPNVQRMNASWVFADSAIQAVRKLKDSNGNYLWQPSVVAGQADLFLGKPIFSDPNIASMATGARFGAFGDMSGFYVRFAGPIRIERSTEAKFENDMVSYRFLVRVDSDVVDTTGIRVIQNA